jgi:hypothetical protein
MHRLHFANHQQNQKSSHPHYSSCLLRLVRLQVLFSKHHLKLAKDSLGRSLVKALCFLEIKEALHYSTRHQRQPTFSISHLKAIHSSPKVRHQLNHKNHLLLSLIRKLQNHSLKQGSLVSQLRSQPSHLYLEIIKHKAVMYSTKVSQAYSHSNQLNRLIICSVNLVFLDNHKHRINLRHRILSHNLLNQLNPHKVFLDNLLNLH